MTDYKALCAELVDNLELILGYFESDECGTSDSEELIARSRTALAQPEPEGPISESELLAMWNQQADAFNQWESLDGGEQLAWAQARAISRFARPAIEPVPVSERLPGPEDTTDRNECWYWHPGKECWEMVPKVTGTVDEWSHWLPHHALPLPTP